jgi:hypothetical protein
MGYVEMPQNIVTIMLMLMGGGSSFFFRVMEKQQFILYTYINNSCIFHNHKNMYLCIIKATRCTNFSNSFWNEFLHVSDDSYVQHQEFLAVYTAMVHVLQVCRQPSSSRIRMELHFHPDTARKLSTNFYDIHHC